jgi:uncharacterized protein (TIGR03032 family)
VRASDQDVDARWSGHEAVWRDPGQIASQWEEADRVEPALLRHRVRGAFWETLAESGATLVISREYEHLLLGLSIDGGRPRVSFMAMPHPSGIACEHRGGSVFVASTRNPNQVFELAPARAALDRLDADPPALEHKPLVPVGSTYFPGSLYIHDLAFIGGTLHANAVGHNAVVRLRERDGWEPVWWPAAVDTPSGPDFRRNYLQLNSIAAGADLEHSFFSASAERVSSRRPGHLNFPVDQRGVIFSGKTRQPAVRGLTRPHSARLHRRRLWVANSGYGELAYADGERSVPHTRLPGWTRGLCFRGDIAFVGTSRVIPRFRSYAPGLDVDRSVCGVHAVDVPSGRVMGSLTWPSGNQIFAVDWLPRSSTLGFPFTATERSASRSAKLLFYSFRTDQTPTKGRRNGG